MDYILYCISSLILVLTCYASVTFIGCMPPILIDAIYCHLMAAMSLSLSWKLEPLPGQQYKFNLFHHILWFKTIDKYDSIKTEQMSKA